MSIDKLMHSAELQMNKTITTTAHYTAAASDKATVLSFLFLQLKHLMFTSIRVLGIKLVVVAADMLCQMMCKAAVSIIPNWTHP